MRCPVDQQELRVAERQGVEIDYCPQCRGVWLDRGELDKIINRVEGEAPRGYGPAQPYLEPGSAPRRSGLGGLVREALEAYRHRDRYRDRHYDYDRRKRRRREGLRDFFDFD